MLGATAGKVTGNLAEKTESPMSFRAVASIGENFTAAIDGHMLDFHMSAFLVEHATCANELDQWRIKIRTSAGEARFDHFSGVDDRCLSLPYRPNPICILGKIGGLVALALVFPRLQPCQAEEVRARVETLLTGSGISLQAFAAWTTEAYADLQARSRKAA